MQINSQCSRGASEATNNLIKRIRLANSLAKIATGESRERLYQVKVDGVIHFAKTFPESIWIDSLNRHESGKWLFGISGFRLGRIHLLVDNPFKILSLIEKSDRLKSKSKEELYPCA
jgi:hypothetical protein